MRLHRAVVATLLAHCGGTDMPSGDGAWAQVDGGRFVPGERPAAMGAERVTEVQSPNDAVRAGQRGKVISGRASGGAYTVALGLDGDVGYWIVPVRSRSVLTPGEVEWDVAMDLAATLPPGARALWMQAGDAQGRFGAAARLDLTVQSTLPAAAVVIALRWDVDADLNLIVVAPDGSTVSNRGVRRRDGSLVIVDPRVGPSLDVDSDARCVRDGRRAENVAWSSRVPGAYAVRVEAWSLCSFASAHYTVTAYDRGVPVAMASGASFEAAPATPGTSTEVLRFEIAP